MRSRDLLVVLCTLFLFIAGCARIQYHNRHVPVEPKEEPRVIIMKKAEFKLFDSDEPFTVKDAEFNRLTHVFSYPDTAFSVSDIEFIRYSNTHRGSQAAGSASLTVTLLLLFGAQQSINSGPYGGIAAGIMILAVPVFATPIGLIAYAAGKDNYYDWKEIDMSLYR